MPKPAILAIERHKRFFHGTISCFREKDATFRPRDGMLTVEGQILHVVAAIELFLSYAVTAVERLGQREWVSRREGRPWIGLDNAGGMEWAAEANLNHRNWPSLTRAVRAFNETMDIAAEVFGQLTEEEMNRRLPRNPQRLPNLQLVFEALIDHTAHHRGALAQYARILAMEPNIPFFNMSEAVHEAQLLTGRAGAPPAAPGRPG